MTDRLPFDPDRAKGARSPDLSSTNPSPSSKSKTLTVSQLTGMIADAIDDALPATVYVEGELSNFKRHGSGHLYFTIKDTRSELSCVMWRSDAAKLKFKPEDGMSVLLAGHVAVFERAGRYQFYVRSIKPQGAGALELAFRQLCEKLQKEGLFDAAHKKPLPRYPSRIAVVTSETGAAVRDITTTLARRYPIAEVLLCPVTVQGPTAAKQIADLILRLNRDAESLGGIDVMIVGRGGGSMEDLWAFNEEAVARAIYASRIPIISAVGHESDVTVADLVADVRAATPTAAAELAAPDINEIQDELTYRAAHLARGLKHALALAASHLTRIAQRPGLSDPHALIEARRRRVNEMDVALKQSIRNRFAGLSQRVHRAELLVHRIDPHRQVTVAAERLVDLQHRLRFALYAKTSNCGRSLESTHKRFLHASSADRVIAARQTTLQHRGERLARSAKQRIALLNKRLGIQEARLTALDYHATLNRGFTITRSQRTGRIVRKTAELREGDRIITDLTDGQVHSRVEDASQPGLFD